jgi:hypothetical protein
MLGSLPEIRARLRRWIATGMDHVGLYLLGDVPAQVALAQAHLGDMFAPRH